MRFNKRPTSINKFSPLPKIDETANNLEEKPVPVPDSHLPTVEPAHPPVSEKVESTTAVKEESWTNLIKLDHNQRNRADKQEDS